MLVDINPKKFKYENYVLPERKTINYSYNSILIRWIILFQCLEYFILNCSIINIKLFVSADLKGDISASFFKINTLNHLSKCAFVNNIAY